MKYETPFPNHVRDRIRERYGVEFTVAQWYYFGQTLCNPKWTIRLSDADQGGHRCACYFMGHWYLLVRTSDGTVTTAYPRLDITDVDKQILMRHDRYRQINHDEFCVWRTLHLAEVAVTMLPREKAVALPEDEELSSDISQLAERFLNQVCDPER